MGRGGWNLLTKWKPGMDVGGEAQGAYLVSHLNWVRRGGESG